MKFNSLFSALLALVVLCMPEGFSTISTSLTTPFLVKRHGYPLEEHTVQTTDGYILTMYRIPSPDPDAIGAKQRPVAFLMHGLLSTSSAWVLGDPLNGLAFLLSDQGFDVWMGNARGNTYSKNHVGKSPLLRDFWNFDWHEIAIYDLTAMIDFVLRMTGADDLHYFGHSQGTTVFFVLNSMFPSYQIRIRSAHLLAPVAFMDHMTHPAARATGNLLGQPAVFAELFGSFEFLPNFKALEHLSNIICKEEEFPADVCSSITFLFGDDDSPHLNKTMLPEIIATLPGGSSTNQVLHYLQEYNSGHFRQFDYGPFRNRIRYGSAQPPDYDIGSTLVATYLYYSDNDNLANVVDVERLISSLDPSSLKEAYRLPFPKWNHLDFLFALDVGELLYKKVIENAKSTISVHSIE